MLAQQTDVLPPAWIENAVETNVPGVTGSTRGPTSDLTAGLTLRWNSGGTEAP
ncbi:hypothetical protein [Streptomyces sp. NBC_01615]|uniref:hypothetical protein n=1 Tax=Streptomyces sp. NBC_01615 TaxID=2975898 RepID=UPI00386353EA